MAFIEQLGVRNVIVEAREAPDNQTLQRVRRVSPGLTFQDLRAARASLGGVAESSARKRVTPTKLVPKPAGDPPVVFGVEASYARVARLALVEGRFFDEDEDAQAAPVCVLGQAARSALVQGGDAVGSYVKVNEQWLRVIGVAGPQLSVDAEVGGVTPQDLNNVVYTPVQSAVLRLEDSSSHLKDEIDGLYFALEPGVDSVMTAATLRGLLNASHKNAGDFSVIVPAQLLAEQRRTQRIFEMVMTAIASISLLVGGIGIMNIMLASILERTREIGVRRAVGARRRDVVRQFLIETMLIACVGGLLGAAAGVGMARLIAALAGWATIVTPQSILLAFLVSVTVGVVFGMYPAIKAARLDPVRALHYE
jgi:putative ABC transport system permease protein